MTKHALKIVFMTIMLLGSVFTDKQGIINYLDSMEGKPHKEVFKSFHFLYEKKYNLNSEEGLRRYKIFKANVLTADKTNQKLGKIVHRITKFMDLTQEEFVLRMLMKPKFMKNSKKSLPPKIEKEEEPEPIYPDGPKLVEETNFMEDHPKLKQTNDVSHMEWEPKIKDQDTCGSCWAFAAIASIENQYHKLTGKLIDFSEQYLVNCDTADGGCDGGWPTRTFKWIAENGILLEESLPYRNFADKCNEDLKGFEYKIVKGAYEFMWMKNKDYAKFLKGGPLVVAMDASFRGFKDYRPKNFDPIDPQYCRGDGIMGHVDHAVVVVGLVTENAQEYLIVRNSWGTDWGYKGYFKIPRNNSCGMTTYAWLPIVVDAPLPNGKPIPPPQPMMKTTIALTSGGFSRRILDPVSDSVCDFGSVPTIDGIKYNDPLAEGKVFLQIFAYKNCLGKDYILDKSYDLSKWGIKFKSIAFRKPLSNHGCVDFYADYCLTGKPISICYDVKDTQTINLTRLEDARSYVVDFNKIKALHYFEEPDFKGKSWYQIFKKMEKNFNMEKFYAGTANGATLKESMSKIRSIKIEYHPTPAPSST